MKGYFYHITLKDCWGKEKILTPKCDGENRGYDEPHVKRICVSSSIEGCLVALGNCITYKNKCYVYRTKNRVSAIRSFGVIDSHVTGEVWLIRPTTFIKYASISFDTLPEDFKYLHTGSVNDIRYQKDMFDRLVCMNNSFLKRIK